MDVPSDGRGSLEASPVSRRLTSGIVVLELHDETRFIALTCTTAGKMTEATARELGPDIRAWLDAMDGRIRILVDCTEMRGTEAGWRSALFETLGPHRSRLRIAWFGMNSLIAITARMFITALSATGPFDGKIFTSRDAALTWLERDVD